MILDVVLVRFYSDRHLADLVSLSCIHRGKNSMEITNVSDAVLSIFPVGYLISTHYIMESACLYHKGQFSHSIGS